MSDLLLNRRAVIKTAAIVTAGSLFSSRLWAQKTTRMSRPWMSAWAAGVPVSSLVKSSDAKITDAELTTKLTECYHDKAVAIAEAYRREYLRQSNLGSVPPCPSWIRGATLLRRRKKKARLGAATAFEYIYAWCIPALNGRPGSFHSAESSIVFDYVYKCVNYSWLTPEGLGMSTNMSSAWANFARRKPEPLWHPKLANVWKEQAFHRVINTPCVVKITQKGRDYAY